jgi:hypothetical protein
MRKAYVFFLSMTLVVFLGANLVLAGAQSSENGTVLVKVSMQDKMATAVDFPLNGDLRALTVADYSTSLGFYNPRGGSYEVPGERIILIRTGY